MRNIMFGHGCPIKVRLRGEGWIMNPHTANPGVVGVSNCCLKIAMALIDPRRTEGARFRERLVGGRTTGFQTTHKRNRTLRCHLENDSRVGASIGVRYAIFGRAIEVACVVQNQAWAKASIAETRSGRWNMLAVPRVRYCANCPRRTRNRHSPG
jgi:hypothetical protein